MSAIPGGMYSISKAAAFNMMQSLRALLAGQGVAVHAVFLGPIDTDMNRGFDIPKASPESAARGIFDGLEEGEEERKVGAPARPRGSSASLQRSCRQARRTLSDVRTSRQKGWKSDR